VQAAGQRRLDRALLLRTLHLRHAPGSAHDREGKENDGGACRSEAGISANGCRRRPADRGRRRARRGTRRTGSAPAAGIQLALNEELATRRKSRIELRLAGGGRRERRRELARFR